MLWRFEEVAGHDGGFKFVAEQFAEVFDAAGTQTRCDRGAEAAWFRVEMFVVRSKEGVEQITVPLEQCARALGDAREMIERDDAEPLGRMRRNSAAWWLRCLICWRW